LLFILQKAAFTDEKLKFSDKKYIHGSSDKISEERIYWWTSLQSHEVEGAVHQFSSASECCHVPTAASRDQCSLLPKSAAESDPQGLLSPPTNKPPQHQSCKRVL